VIGTNSDDDANGRPLSKRDDNGDDDADDDAATLLVDDGALHD
jgi:hypothetical protein